MNEAPPIASVADDISDYLVSTARSFSGLERLSIKLREAEGSADLLSTWAWFENLESHGVEPALERMLLIVEYRHSGAAFCLPLLYRQRSGAPVFGTTIASLSNYYNSLYGPIGDIRHLNEHALRAALIHLRRNHAPCKVIDLHPRDSNGPFFKLMQCALRAEGYSTDSYFRFGNWHLDEAGRRYAEYEPTTPFRLRKTIKRGRRKLASDWPWCIQVHRDPGLDLDCAVTEFRSIYAKSWKAPEPFSDFVPGLCRTAAALGWLRLGVLRHKGAPIAAQIWLVKHGKALIYKLASDDDYKRFSAGSVLSAEMMRSAIDDDGVDDVDYLTGDDDYRTDWMPNRRERVGLLAFAPFNAQGSLSYLYHRIGQWLRLQRRARRPPNAQETAPHAATTSNAVRTE